MNLLNRPLKVFVICLLIAIANLTLNGTFLRLYKLDRDAEVMTSQMQKTRQQIGDLEKQIKFAKDPAFLEKQALDNYDLATEDDLIFVFSDEDQS